VTLTIVGTVYIVILYGKQKCQCRLCKRDFLIEECIGEGGFGAVYKVKKNALEHGRNKITYILKKLEMSSLNELEKV
jgi:hypothetical protein